MYRRKDRYDQGFSFILPMETDLLKNQLKKMACCGKVDSFPGLPQEEPQTVGGLKQQKLISVVSQF
jgi:hypothetical protein